MKQGLRKILIACISVMMLLTSNSYPMNVAAADNVNLALGKPATVSSFETTGFEANKAVDGNINTHWGTAQNKAKNEWLEVDLGASVSIKQMNVLFERTDANQNVLGYKVEIFNGSAYELAYTKSEKAKQNEIIVLPEVKQGSKVKITIIDADGGTLNWVNVGISELEVYSKEKIEAEDSENVNHIAGATMSASTVEDNLAILAASKANDGDKTTRWSSEQTNTGSQWLKATLTKPTVFKQFNFVLHTRDIAPLNSNIEQFSIKYIDVEGNEQYAVKDFKNTPMTDGFQTKVKVILDEEIIAQSITICEFVAKAPTWNNIGINEVEGYSNEVDESMSLEAVVESIKGKVIAKDVDKLPMPTVPDAFTVKINGADFEQIVANNGAIVHPLTDKTVNISFEVTEKKTTKTALTGDLVFTIAGIHEQQPDKNSKPVIMPELAEWYSESNEKLAVSSMNKVVYDDASLSAVVDEFIADYQDYTGVTLTKVQSATPAANAYAFKLEAPDALVGEEGYTMDITADRVLVKSSDVTGNMYGMQTILQMLKQSDETFSIGSIRDYPRFSTRGFLLDVARKPMSMQVLKEMSRTMRYYKMNDFQIHLSDNYIFLEQYGCKDQEMEAFKAYDAFRLESGLSNDKGQTPTAEDYSYSKELFRDFITEERAVGMKIVPEIDVPAHANSFTKIWPEIMVKGKVSSLNTKRPLIDHIDVSKPEAVNKVKEIFDDYTKGENPTFDAETTVHIGADEFLDSYTAYRNFINTLVPHVKETNTVRMWGGLTWLDDGKTEINKDAIENVEMNLWSSSWADGIQMYNMGYKVINTIDDYTYMVPSGSKTRSNAYGDMLNVNRIFDSFEANRLGTRSGYKMIPSGDDQAIGAAFAMWHDNIDKSASGLSEADMYWRFFDALPFFAEKTWAATGKEKGTSAAVSALAQQQGTGPNTNPYFQEKKTGDHYERYDFDEGLKDTSGNNRDLTAGTAQIQADALTLSGKDSYVESPIRFLGNDNTLSFDITLTAPAKPGQILFESDAPYGTHDLRIMADGSLGFTRELYDYSFDYELPVGKKVNVQIETSQQKTKLYIDGDFVADATGKFIHNDMVKKSGIVHSTFALPLQRFGSKTNAIQAVMDNIAVFETKEKEDVYKKSAWTGTTDTETIFDETEGKLIYAFDNDPATIWHSNWKGTSDKLTGTNSFFAEINFAKPFKINQFSFTPRSPQASGQVTKADLYVKGDAADEWKLVAQDKIFAADATKKTFHFEEQEVQYVKFVAKASNDGWVAVSEFDIDYRPASTLTVYVQSAGNGSVTGGASVAKGENVTVHAVPNKGYAFDGWYKEYGDQVSDQADYTFAVNANTALTARFIKDDSITYTVTIDGVSQSVMDGELANVTTPVKPGHRFDGFYEAGSDTAFDFSQPIDRDVTVISRFTPYQVTLTSTQHGTICVSGMNDQGEVTLNAKANEGYEFVGWYAEGNKLSSDTPYTFVVVEDILVSAVFREKGVEDTTAWREILSTAIKKAQDLEANGALEGVHDKVVAFFRTSLNGAVGVYANAKATNEELMNAWLQLAEAMHYLDFKADKTKLSALIDECERLDLSIYEDDANKVEYLAAKAHADAVMSNENALEASITAAFNRLSDAKNSLQLKVTIDTIVIDYMISQGEKAMAKKDMYDTSAESWKTFEQALADAKAAREAMATQAEINAAAVALSEAYENIRLIANEDVLKELQDFVAMMNNVNAGNYAREDVMFFQAAKAMVQKMIDEGSFTMGAYEEALAVMSEATQRLEHGELKPALPNIDPTPEAAKPSGTGSVNTGDASDELRMLFGSMFIVGMLGFVIIRKSRKAALK